MKPRDEKERVRRDEGSGKNGNEWKVDYRRKRCQRQRYKDKDNGRKRKGDV